MDSDSESDSQHCSIRRRKSRLKRAVKRGSLSRVSRLLPSGDCRRTLINAELNSRGRSALHIACRRGHHKLALWLLKHGANCRLVDPLGNSALHLAVQRFVDRDMDKECEENVLLVLTLIRAYRVAFRCANSDGQSPERLLRPFMKKLEKNRLSPSPLRTFLTAVQCCLERLDEEELKRGEEERWNSHCFEQYLEEQEELDGGEWQFSQEYQTETCYERLDRLADEVRKRKRQPYVETQEKVRERMKRKRQEEAERNHPSDREIEKRALTLKPLPNDRTLQAVSDEKRFQEVLVGWTTDCKQLGFDDIPWPSGSSVKAMLDTLLYGTDATSVKARVRELLKRWHPDKFVQKFKDCLKESDHDKILERVTELSQALTKHPAI